MTGSELKRHEMTIGPGTSPCRLSLRPLPIFLLFLIVVVGPPILFQSKPWRSKAGSTWAVSSHPSRIVCVSLQQRCPSTSMKRTCAK